ncbi:MAG: hypothetical protein KBH75_10335, partial [Saprospiraceae bacterium]|nr:hypothetical protein [Saprospiraceae bacterium]
MASNFYIDVCGTSIILNYPYMLGNPIKTYPSTIVPNTWHLLSIRSNSNGSSISTLIDGAIASIHLVLPPHVGFISSDLIIGGAVNSWMGKIDELKIWSTNNPPVSSHNCPCSGNEPKLLVYIPFDDDFGVTSVNDKANSALLQFGNNSGQLLGAPTIICSDAPLIYPDYYNLELDITDYWNPTTVINSICSGDPAHFCLMQDGNIVEFPNVPAIPNTSTSVIWEYADLPGGLWMPVTPQAPAFKEFCFPVAPNLIVASCPNSDVLLDGKCYHQSLSESTALCTNLGGEVSGNTCQLNPTCPSGGTFDGANDVCHLTYAKSCTSGSYDTISNACVLEPICDGGTLNTALDKCQLSRDVVCSIGTKDLITGKCTFTASCQSNATLIVDKCTNYPIPLTCPSGTDTTLDVCYSNINDCYVDSSYVNANTLAYSLALKTCLVEEKIACATGLTWSEAYLKCEAVPICYNGMY